MSSKRFDSNFVRSGSIEISKEVDSVLSYDLFGPTVTDEKEDANKLPNIPEPIQTPYNIPDEESKKEEETSNLLPTATEEEKVKETPKQKKTPAEKKQKTSVRLKEGYIGEKKRGRKKKFEEPRIAQFVRCGDSIYSLVTDNAIFERKKKNTYLCDLIQREKEMFEKEKERYIETRRKKAEVVNKKEKDGTKSISFNIDQSLAMFLDDIQYDILCSKELFFRTIIELDAERIAKKKNK